MTLTCFPLPSAVHLRTFLSPVSPTTSFFSNNPIETSISTSTPGVLTRYNFGLLEALIITTLDQWLGLPSTEPSINETASRYLAQFNHLYVKFKRDFPYRSCSQLTFPWMPTFQSCPFQLLQFFRNHFLYQCTLPSFPTTTPSSKTGFNGVPTSPRSPMSLFFQMSFSPFSVPSLPLSSSSSSSSSSATSTSTPLTRPHSSVTVLTTPRPRFGTLRPTTTTTTVSSSSSSSSFSSSSTPQLLTSTTQRTMESSLTSPLVFDKSRYLDLLSLDEEEEETE